MLRLRLALILLAPALAAQQPAAPMPRDYRGPEIRVDGIFVTPIPGAPFSATVEIVSHNKLPGGTEHVVKTENYVARTSSGRIRNERRQLVPLSFTGVPRLLSAHLYDPNSRVNTYTFPEARIARQNVMPQPPRTPATFLAPDKQPQIPGITVTSIGQQYLDGVQLVGTRKTRVVPATASGTGQPITITDDYWYSPDLSIYLIIRHDDPRTGEQLVAVTHIQRGEPEASQMQVPESYKVVDETPPPRENGPDYQ